MPRPDVVVRFGGDDKGVNDTLRHIRNEVSGSADALSKAFRFVGGAYAVRQVAALSTAIAEAHENTALLRTQMARLSGSEGGLGIVVDLADELGQNIGDTAKAINFFTPTFQKLGKTFAESAKFIGDLSKAMRVYGVSSAAATKITEQLSQAFSSGQLAGDELKSLSENAAGLYVALEKAVQEILKSKSTLKELGSQGKVTSDVIYQAFQQAFSGIRGEMESMPATLEQQKARMENAWQSLLSAIDEKVHQSDAWKWITGKLSSAFTFAAIDLGNLDVPTEDLKNALEALERRIKELAEIGGVIEKELSPALQDAAKAIQDALKAREEEKEGATGGNKPGGATTVGPSDSFKKALDKRIADTRTALQIERELWAAYSRERSAKNQEDAQKAQQAQEEAFAALSKSGASKTLLDYYAGLVGQLGEKPIKTKMVVQLDEQSFLELDDRMEQILNGKEYDVTLKAKVQPELIWTDADSARGNVAAREAAQTGSVGEQ